MPVLCTQNIYVDSLGGQMRDYKSIMQILIKTCNDHQSTEASHQRELLPLPNPKTNSRQDPISMNPQNECFFYETSG